MTIELIINEDVDANEADIFRDYWEVGEDGNFIRTVSSLLKEHKITQNELTKILRSSGRANMASTSCHICGDLYPLENRASIKNIMPDASWICTTCKEESISAQNDKKREAVRSVFENRLNSPISIQELTVRQAVLLLALLKITLNEGMDFIHPYASNVHELFSPDSDYDYKILKELYGQGVIAINPDSDMSTIELKEDGNFSFYLDRVEWIIPLEAGYSLGTFYKSLEDLIRSQIFVATAYDDVVNLCKEISKIECLSYLDAVLAEHQLGYSLGEKTHAVIARALESYTVAQVYNFIWRAAKDAAAFYVRNRTSKDHAAKTVVGNIERQLERAAANNWNVTAFRRNFDRPQSMVSRVLFNLLLGTDDGGFNMPLWEIL